MTIVFKRYKYGNEKEPVPSPFEVYLRGSFLDEEEQGVESRVKYRRCRDDVGGQSAERQEYV